MDLKTLLDDPRLNNTLTQIDRHCKDKVFSDIVDAQGNQYVDLVMEGGGMLGIALVGYIHALEHAGIRFLGLGGTSAGSITALLLAGLDEPGQPKSEKLLRELANKNFIEFVDGDADARDLISSWIEGAGSLKLAIKAAQVIDNLKNNLGLNPGKTFTEWLTRLLKDNGIETVDQLLKRVNTWPTGLTLRPERAPQTLDENDDLFGLAIIAADITTETKVEFPRMAGLYWRDVGNLNPALFARASMSIPYFFEPMTVTHLPDTASVRARWETLANFSIADAGKVPDTVLFIDGGVMSNFPIDIFHNTRKVPRAPTFGVKLELDKKLASINGPLELFNRIFNAARHTLDYDFIRRNPDYKQLVTWIPAEGFNWLDFNMSDAKKTDLFLEGAQCAADFLSTFDWKKYKALRQLIAEQARLS